MTEGQLRLSDYLRHILEAIERVERYTADMTEAAFLENEMAQDAVIRNFEIIGEASRNIERRYPEITARRPGIPWGSAYEMRNALSHGYFKVDLEIVWKTVRADLPDMRSQVRSLLHSLSE